MFLDTSGLYCYFDTDETQNSDAETLFEASGRKWTHNYVLAEFLALATARGQQRTVALEFLRNLMLHSEVVVIWVDRELHDAAIGLLGTRLDKTYSLCDAVSFVLMHDCGLTDALTGDRHFEQEGFRRLLK